jgi:hypothetical protein
LQGDRRPCRPQTWTSINGPLTDADLDPAAAAIAAGAVLQRCGLTTARARDLLVEAVGQMVIARANSRALGVAVYWTDGRTPVPACVLIRAVNEGSRDRGVGLALLRFVQEQDFRRGPNLFLCCVTTNTGARRFHERYGHGAVGMLHDLIAAGIDEIL